MFDAAERQETLEACGIEVATESGATLFVTEPQWADAQMKHSGRQDDVAYESPLAQADYDDVKRLGIVGAEDGTILVFGATRYRVLAVEPERNGFCTLTLGAV